MNVDWVALLLIVAGILVLLCTLYDFLATVLTVSGGGPLSSRVQVALWRALVRVHRRRPSHARLANAGPVFALGTVLAWLTGLWLGWVLIFISTPEAVVNSTTGNPAQFGERLYFVGYTLTTLGLGDMVPDGSAWQLATVLASASGLFLFTMAITYIVPLVSATAEMRSLAAYMRLLGRTPDAIIGQSLHRDELAPLESHLVALAPMISTMTQRFLSYPILHFFHSPESDTAFPVRLAVLDESLTVLTCALIPDRRLPVQVTTPARGAIEGFLDVLHSAHIEPADDSPPVPTRHDRLASLEWVEETELEAQVGALSCRRRKLLALLEADGWRWQDVTQVDS